MAKTNFDIALCTWHCKKVTNFLHKNNSRRKRNSLSKKDTKALRKHDPKSWKFIHHPIMVIIEVHWKKSVDFLQHFAESFSRWKLVALIGKRQEASLALSLGFSLLGHPAQWSRILETMFIHCIPPKSNEKHGGHQMTSPRKCWKK